VTASRSFHDAVPHAYRLASLLREIRAAGFDVHTDAEGVAISGTDGHVRVSADGTIISCGWEEK
jgi:hypothetical protein